MKEDMRMSEIEILKKHTNNMRKNIIKMVTEAKSGHPGGSLSSVEMVAAIYFKEMNLTAENINSIEWAFNHKETAIKILQQYTGKEYYGC